MSSFDDTNEMKSFVKKAMSIPLLEENHEKVLAKKEMILDANATSRAETRLGSLTT